LRDTLLAEDIGFVLAHATRLRAIAEANYKKDEIDAELLARMRVAGCIPEVHAKGPAQRELALVVRHRAWLVRDRTAVVNRMHAQLHAVGLRMERGRLLTKKGQRWVGEAAWPLLRPEQRRLMRTHVRIIRQLQVTIRGLDRRIRQLARRDPACALLETIPGIGSYRALMIAAEVQPISRFRTSNRLVSYAGQAPASSRSYVTDEATPHHAAQRCAQAVRTSVASHSFIGRVGFGAGLRCARSMRDAPGA